jgi:hypothetical protein
MLQQSVTETGQSVSAVDVLDNVVRQSCIDADVRSIDHRENFPRRVQQLFGSIVNTAR